MQCAFLEFFNFQYFATIHGLFVPSDHFVNSNMPILPNTWRYPKCSAWPMNLVTHKFPLFPLQISTFFRIHGRCRLNSKNSLSRHSKNLSLIEMHSNRFPIQGLFLIENLARDGNKPDTKKKRMCYRRFTHFTLPNLFHAKTVLRVESVCGLEGPQLICHGVFSVSL